MSETTSIVAAVISLIITIGLYIFILPDSKRASLNNVCKKIHDFLKIRGLITEAIFRFLYVSTVVSCVVEGIFLLFEDFGKGLLLIILGPIASRILFEVLLIAFLLVRNVIEINNHLKGIEPINDEEEKISVGEVISNIGKKMQDITTTATTTSSQEPKKDEKTCANCGKVIPEGSTFCVHCGTKVE